MEVHASTHNYLIEEHHQNKTERTNQFWKGKLFLIPIKWITYHTENSHRNSKARNMKVQNRDMYLYNSNSIYKNLSKLPTIPKVRTPTLCFLALTKWFKTRMFSCSTGPFSIKCTVEVNLFFVEGLFIHSCYSFTSTGNTSHFAWCRWIQRRMPLVQ